ncbi:SGNH/GDSL hydrolase family protein [Paenibacillus sp. PL91]|uniref:SGNH/GDSL hydrolase family protein n=1 Tax=Paenibacillus sp. PL91 TaxID=2729538 RepID=UPI00145F8BC6|nr:SGNH/GDSL hydrolase family protein [Paenibacillus sp. PL91]MBC9201260.1 SGNH/GDSL hydrolase family protein [Paenibacillus sp. PL91]
MTLSIWNHRNKLQRTRQKIEEGRLTVGFIGGSITDARPRHNWPEPVIGWLAEQYPNTRITVENAAIGATGSDLAAFRAKRDLTDPDCDLVFIEYAVNDENEPTMKRNRTREGLIRQLLAAGRRDIVIVYTYSQNMYDAMQSGAVPDTISEFERIAEYYQIGSVWMGLYAFEEVKKGRLRFEEWLPDGLHPTSRGSLSYGQSVIAYLTKELMESDTKEARQEASLPEPLDVKCWDDVYALSFDQVQTSGPWAVRRWPHLEWIDHVLETSAVGAGLSFSFEGRGLALGFDFGRSSAEFRYRIDGGEWLTSERERPSWLAEDGWYRLSCFGDDWAGGSHRFELEVIHGNRANCTGTNFRLAKVGIIR